MKSGGDRCKFTSSGPASLRERRESACRLNGRNSTLPASHPSSTNPGKDTQQSPAVWSFFFYYRAADRELSGRCLSIRSRLQSIMSRDFGLKVVAGCTDGNYTLRDTSRVPVRSTPEDYLKSFELRSRIGALMTVPNWRSFTKQPPHDNFETASRKMTAAAAKTLSPGLSLCITDSFLSEFKCISLEAPTLD